MGHLYSVGKPRDLVKKKNNNNSVQIISDNIFFNDARN